MNAYNKLSPEQKIQSLTEEEFRIYWKAIEKNENWEVGREDFIERWYIAGVHKKKGIVYEYLIKTSKGVRWIAKADAFKLASQNRLRAILVHIKSGSLCLRPESGMGPFKLIVE